MLYLLQLQVAVNNFLFLLLCMKNVTLMKIETGKGQITLAALIGIWSVSALTSLPGLAVSPILDKLKTIFPSASEFDIQLLTSLPSLLIIPFVLLAGHLTTRVPYYRLLAWGLWLFLLSGVLYFFCGEMWQLIAVSALLGIGSGIIIPLSTSLVSRFFVGDYRVRQFGYASAIANITLVLATALAGYLADVQWRLPFMVYLLPIVSIVLIPSMSVCDGTVALAGAEQKNAPVGSVNFPRLLPYMLYYLLVTYLTVVVSFNLPFLMGELKYGSDVSGVVISLFFLAIMAPGFVLSPILRVMKGGVEWICLLLIAVGLLLIFSFSSLWIIALGCIVSGVGYGIVQPYLYDCVTKVSSASKVAFALALLMAMNYVAILVCPFIVDYLQRIMHVESQSFAFGLNAVVAFAVLLAMLAVYICKRKR